MQSGILGPRSKNWFLSGHKAFGRGGGARRRLEARQPFDRGFIVVGVICVDRLTQTERHRRPVWRQTFRATAPPVGGDSVLRFELVGEL